MLRDRLPSAPLVELLPTQRPHREDVARRAGYGCFVNMRRVLRRPTIGVYTADRIAVALGMHPVEVYPSWYGCNEEGGDYEAS